MLFCVTGFFGGCIIFLLRHCVIVFFKRLHGSFCVERLGEFWCGEVLRFFSLIHSHTHSGCMVFFLEVARFFMCGEVA